MLLVPGLILASGRSERMGRPKALLTVGSGGPTFVAQLVAAFQAGGLDDVLVIGRPADEALRAEVERLAGPVRYVENPHAEHGQLSSVIAGLNAVDRPGVAGILIMPVDVPLVRSRTIGRVLEAFSRTRAPIVRATHDGRHGHPVIFAHAVFGDLRRTDLTVGAKAVLRAHAGAILNVEVDDPGVLVDIDDPEAYTRAFGRPL